MMDMSNMQVLVKSVVGENFLLDVSPESTVFQLKQQLKSLQGVNVEDINLNFGLFPLNDEDTLAECGIEAYSTIFQSLSLLGGGKKRKKKTYTKPKKIKHKKKKVKLAVLKFYKVDGNDKVTRLRKECPICGNGVFMAMHHNRNYCGRCGISYVQKSATEEA